MVMRRSVRAAASQLARARPAASAARVISWLASGAGKCAAARSAAARSSSSQWWLVSVLASALWRSESVVIAGAVWVAVRQAARRMRCAVTMVPSRRPAMSWPGPGRRRGGSALPGTARSSSRCAAGTGSCWLAAWTDSASGPQAVTGLAQCVARPGRAAPAGRGRDLVAGGGHPCGQVGDLGQQRPANRGRGEGWRPFGAVDGGAVRGGADVGGQQLAAGLEHDGRAVHLPRCAGRRPGARVQPSARPAA